MNILILNAGSSTLKYMLMNMSNNEVLASGVVDRINQGNQSFIVYKTKDEKHTKHKVITSHKEGLDEVLAMLTDKQLGVIASIRDIFAFGHRFVHGGGIYNESVLITNEVLINLTENAELAPLHIPASIVGINACLEISKNIPNVAVFDTAFHSKMPEYAYRYAIPKRDYEEFKIRRYGFHGTSHYYVSNEYAKIVGKKVEDLKIITCHLGNGSSISAVEGGHSIDTSMGFTPLEGLIMGTRSGDLDPAVVEFISKKRGLTLADTINYLNKKSGILGLTDGLTSDMRELEEHLDNPDCQLTLQIMSYRLKKYIGAYHAVLGGADAIVFTGGIGENDHYVRELSVSGLEKLGITLNKQFNEQNIRGVNRKISANDSNVDIYIIPTNEEMVIAQETLRVVNQK